MEIPLKDNIVVFMTLCVVHAWYCVSCCDFVFTMVDLREICLVWCDFIGRFVVCLASDYSTRLDHCSMMFFSVDPQRLNVSRDERYRSTIPKG